MYKIITYFDKRVVYFICSNDFYKNRYGILSHLDMSL